MIWDQPRDSGNWVKRGKINRGETESLNGDERAGLARLRQEVTELRMERRLGLARLASYSRRFTRRRLGE